MSTRIFRPPRSHKQNAFTLLEVLLAVFIFALISTGAYQLSSAAQKSAAAIKSSQERLRDIGLTFEILEKDLTQIVARAWRDPYGNNYNPPLQTDLASDYVIRLIRSGWRNPLGINRSDQQLVTYRLVDDTLQRLHTVHLDNLASTVPLETDLLDKVSVIEMTFFDRQRPNNPSQILLDKWPPFDSNQQNQTSSSGDSLPLLVYPLPIAIEIALELEDLGKISRIIPLAAGA